MQRKMSAATQKPLGDLSRSTPAFSYAQAAKGRSPSGPPSVSTEKTPREDPATNCANASTAEHQDTIHSTGRLSSKRAASEGNQSRNSNITGTAETVPPVQRNPDPSTTPAATTPATQASEQSQVVVSTPSSPEYGITSASTLLKDDDLFSNANASSDSTWEKLSQGSQNGSKSNEKIENEKEPEVNGPWDEGAAVPPAPPALKEASPPAVNFWKQRIDAQAAKQSTNMATTSSVNQTTTTAQTNGANKPFDIGAEARKHDSKRQARRAIGGVDEKPAAAGAKDGIRYANGKAAAAEIAEVGSQRIPRMVPIDNSKSVSLAPPPPPGDAQSWPTPDSAQDEEKRKIQERADRGEKEKPMTIRAHGKEKWMPVPYVPTYVPSTPLPNVRRGPRATRGGRDSAPRGGGLATDKVTAGSPEASTGSRPLAGERSKADLANSRTSIGSTRPKRASSAGPPATRDQRRGGDLTGSERRKDMGSSTLQGEARRASATTQEEAPRSKREPNVNEAQPGTAKGFQEPDGDGAATGGHAYPRSAGPERRGEAGLKTYDHAREFHNAVPARERGEGRPGRGGHRSRGVGSNAFGHTNVPNSHVTPHSYVQPPVSSKSFPLHERHPSQYPHNGYQPRQSHSRFRSGSHSYPATHPTANARFPQGHHATGSHHLPNLQTEIASAWAYQPGSQGIMSANPYTPYMEQVSIVGMVSMQMEYYFSVDNLCKDLYLRRHMDSQGFVFLSVLAKFNRIRQLTQDLELVRYVCLHSPQIEFRIGSDGYDRLRKREGWQQWILAMEERDPSAQNDGPGQVQEPSLQQQPSNRDPYSLDNREIISPRLDATNPHQNSDSTPLPYSSTSPSRPIVNGSVNGAVNSHVSYPTTGPEFASGLPTLSHPEEMSAKAYPSVENTFSDEQVDLLMIVVRKSLNHSMQPLPPFHSSSSRTFSNGSIDGRTITDELTKFNENDKLAIATGESASEV